MRYLLPGSSNRFIFSTSLLSPSLLAGLLLGSTEASLAMTVRFTDLDLAPYSRSETQCAQVLASDEALLGYKNPSDAKIDALEVFTQMLMEYWYGTEQFSLPYFNPGSGGPEPGEVQLQQHRRTQYRRTAVENMYKEIHRRLFSPFGLKQKFRQALVEMGRYQSVEDVPHDFGEVPIEDHRFFLELAKTIDAQDLLEAVEKYLNLQPSARPRVKLFYQADAPTSASAKASFSSPPKKGTDHDFDQTVLLIAAEMILETHFRNGDSADTYTLSISEIRPVNLVRRREIEQLRLEKVRSGDFSDLSSWNFALWFNLLRLTQEVYSALEKEKNANDLQWTELRESYASESGFPEQLESFTERDLFFFIATNSSMPQLNEFIELVREYVSQQREADELRAAKGAQ